VRFQGREARDAPPQARLAQARQGRARRPGEEPQAGDRDRAVRSAAQRKESPAQAQQPLDNVGWAKRAKRACPRRCRNIKHAWAGPLRGLCPPYESPHQTKGEATAAAPFSTIIRRASRLASVPASVPIPKFA